MCYYLSDRELLRFVGKTKNIKGVFMQEENVIKKEENVISFADVFAVIKKKFVLFIAIVVAMSALGAVYSYFFMATEYTATASLSVKVETEYGEPSKIIEGPDGKKYTIIDASKNSAEEAALSYATTIAHNALAFFNTNNDVVYVAAMEKYNKNYLEAAAKPVKLSVIRKGLSCSSQSSQIFLAFKSTVNNPEKMLQCIIDSFLETVNEKDGEKAVFEVYADRISVLSEPLLQEPQGRFSRVVKYTLVFFVAGVAVSLCVAVLIALSAANKKHANKN